MICPTTPPPSPAGPLVETALLKAVRIYLDDAQSFLKTQPKIDKDKIGDIALEARKLQDSISKLDEAGASRSRWQLDDLLRPIDGFVEFLAGREAGRQRELVRRFTLASAAAEKGSYFITEFLRDNLGYPKTETLLNFKRRLESSVRPNAVTDSYIDEVNGANAALETFVSDNLLSAEYSRIVQRFGKPQPGTPPPTPALPITEKTRIALAGPDEDMVLLYNAAPSAPSVAKDIAGKLVFLTGNASVCFAQSAMDDDRLWFLERTLRQQGAKEIWHDGVPCNFAQVPTAIDIVVFHRVELRKQRPDYIQGLVDLLENDGLREYKVVTEADYNAEIQKIRAVSLTIASDVESNRRTGFGILVVTDAGTPACAVTSNHVTELGLKELLRRDKQLISRRLRFDWNVVDMTVDNAFVALTRLQCGYAAGEAAALRSLMLALRRDGKQYEFAPIWFSVDEVTSAGTER
jgi:hypothetical protein